MMGFVNMPNRFVSVLLASILASASVAALAQTAPAAPPANGASTTVAPVTVEAGAPPKVIKRQTESFVHSYAAVPNPEIGQIARWRDPVCVQVEGLPRADQAAAIKARIESVAQAVGVRAARANCKANVEIVFTSQPQQTMDLVAKRREDLLGYDHRQEHDRLKTVTRPIQAWYQTATRGEGVNNAGMAFAIVKDAAGEAISNPGNMPGQSSADETIDEPDSSKPTGCANAPRFTACLQSVFRNIFMIADSNALQGKDLGAVADYLAMLALSQPRSLDGCNSFASVIDLMAKAACPGRDPPDGMTPTDAAYLTALYKADLDGFLQFEQGDISNRMAEILVKAEGARTK